jgi:carbonic anhydrase
MWSYDEGTENGPEVWGDLCVEYAKCSQGYSFFVFIRSITPPPRFLLMMPMHFFRHALLG